jgi:N-formylglutamate amidohydrolase
MRSNTISNAEELVRILTLHESVEKILLDQLIRVKRSNTIDLMIINHSKISHGNLLSSKFFNKRDRFKKHDRLGRHTRPFAKRQNYRSWIQLILQDDARTNIQARRDKQYD